MIKPALLIYEQRRCRSAAYMSRLVGALVFRCLNIIISLAECFETVIVYSRLPLL